MPWNCLPQGGYGVGNSRYPCPQTRQPWKAEARNRFQSNSIPFEVSPAKCVPWLDHPDSRINSSRVPHDSLDSTPPSVKKHYSIPQSCQPMSTYQRDCQNSSYFRRSNAQTKICCPEVLENVEPNPANEPMKTSKHEREQEGCDNLKLVISSERNGEHTLVVPSDILLKCLGMFHRNCDKVERVSQSKRLEKQESSCYGLSGPVDIWAIVSFLYQLLMQFVVFYCSCSESSSSEEFHAKPQKISEEIKAIQSTSQHEPTVTGVDADDKKGPAGDQSNDTETNKFLTLDETNTYRRRLPPPSLDLKFICEDIIPKQCVLKVCSPEVDLNLGEKRRPCYMFSDNDEKVEEDDEDEEEIEVDEAKSEMRLKKRSIKAVSADTKSHRKGKKWKRFIPCIKGEPNSPESASTAKGSH